MSLIDDILAEQAGSPAGQLNLPNNEALVEGLADALGGNLYNPEAGQLNLPDNETLVQGLTDALGGNFYNPEVGELAELIPDSDASGAPLTNLGGLLTTIGTTALQNKQIQRQAQLGQQAAALADQLIADTERRGTFKPFTVTTDLATTAATPEGGFGITLGQTPKDIQNQALTQALTGVQGLGTSRSQREQEIFDRLEAIRQPQRDRELQGLLNAENAAGRLGLGLGAYGGGNPNLFGRQQVIEEQRARDALTAIEAARGERADDLALTQGLLQLGYAPETRAITATELGRDVAVLPQQLQREVLLAAANTGRTGIEGLVNANRVANELRNIRDARVGQDILGGDGTEGLLGLGLDALGGTEIGDFLNTVSGNPVGQIAIGGLLGGIFG
jgi:hypothetical protein